MLCLIASSSLQKKKGSPKTSQGPRPRCHSSKNGVNEIYDWGGPINTTVITGKEKFYDLQVENQYFNLENLRENSKSE